MPLRTGIRARLLAASLAAGCAALPAAAQEVPPEPDAAASGHSHYTLYRTLTHQSMASFNDFVYGALLGGGVAAGGALAAASLVTEPITFYLHESVWQALAPHTGPADLGLTATKTATYTLTNMGRVFASGWLLTGNPAFAAGFVAFNAVGDAIVYSVNDLAWTCITAVPDEPGTPPAQSATPAICRAATQPNVIAGPSVMPPPG